MNRPVLGLVLGVLDGLNVLVGADSPRFATLRSDLVFQHFGSLGLGAMLKYKI